LTSASGILAVEKAAGKTSEALLAQVARPETGGNCPGNFQPTTAWVNVVDFS